MQKKSALPYIFLKVVAKVLIAFSVIFRIYYETIQMAEICPSGWTIAE